MLIYLAWEDEGSDDDNDDGCDDDPSDGNLRKRETLPLLMTVKLDAKPRRRFRDYVCIQRKTPLKTKRRHQEMI